MQNHLGVLMGVTHLSNTYKLFKINALILIFDSCDLPKCLSWRSPTPCNTVNPDIFYCSIFNRLQEYLVKGFVMDDERLKNPPVGSSVLERIRDIHASMRRVYLQVICPPADSQPTVSPLRWRCCFTRPRTPFFIRLFYFFNRWRKKLTINFTNNQTAIKINLFI